MTYTEDVTSTVEAKTTSDQTNGNSTVEENETRGLNVSASSTASEGPQNFASDPVAQMGSTDSSGNATGGPSCGLVSSLFPSSCRGRAEAFARRLHHRLTSLGSEDDGQNDGQVAKASETSWLHAAPNANVSRNHVLERQPRHSSDSDLYFDFDIDEDAPGSPAEEATDAELTDLLVNSEACRCSPGPRTIPNQGPESGCVFSSPVTGTSLDSDSSEVYFDPESSDADRMNDSFYDPEASESEISNLSNGGNLMAKVLSHRHGSPRFDKLIAAYETESSDSSESNGRPEHTITNHTKGNHVPKILTKNDISCKRETSPEDSLNGMSSQDTTSASHESLWSTFEDSTLSLQDESPSRGGVPSTGAPNVRKSHSDSEIPSSRLRMEVPVKREAVAEVDEVDFVNEASRNVDNGETTAGTARIFRNLSKETEDELEPHRDVPESSENGENSIDDHNCVDDPSRNVSNEEKDKESIENLTNLLTSNLPCNEDGQSDTDTDHSTYSSTINIPGALTLECPSGTRIPNADESVRNEVRWQVKDGVVLNGSDEKMAELLKRLGGNPMLEEDESKSKEISDEQYAEEEEEEEEGRPQRVRRCSSLKTGKTPPGTPGRKKIVRFADVLGLDLADVRTFLDEIPKVPNSAYSDLIYDDTLLKDIPPAQHNWHARYVDTRESSSPVGNKPDRTLVPLFQQPGGMSNFLDLVRERQVCLENVLVRDPMVPCLQGSVRVRNLDFHKSVHVRYTINGWRSFSDLQATYVANSCDGFSDKFTFILYCHTLNIGQRLEFAVRYQCKGIQYWDNNGGANYCFQCLPSAPSIGYIPITASETNVQDWSPTFY